MKKFKLIKKYPGVPVEIGFTVEKNNNYYVDPFTKIILSHKDNIENHPEFWEEIIEKDYEILSYKHNGSNHIWKQDSQLKDTFCIQDGHSPFTRLEDILKYPKIYSIHSIKKLSDGEVFTIGDKILTIESFIKEIDMIYIKDNKLCINLKQSNYRYYLNEIKKVKQPLFTTEDGVEIFEGDKYSWVNYLLTPGYNITAHKSHSCKEGMKFFSTKEKAEEYILINKPYLTLNEVKFIILTNQNKQNCLNKLTDLVKTKLK